MDSAEATINFDNETYEVLDFEDDNFSSMVSRTKSKTMDVDENTNRKSNADDEGELKSDEDSGLDEDNSSEEGEVQSEIDEMEVPAAAAQSPVRNETPWERGLRLAREKLEKVKALKASEKDLAEKRLTLSVAAPEVQQESTRVTRDDVFWLYYYKSSIVGRTELTCQRFLPEDLQPPSASELAEWRLGISGDYHGHRRRRYRRDSSGSRSSSSLSSSSSRASSLDSASEASSLFSVAASWKATCARAMKDYLSSPIRNKDRRMDRLRSSSLSSGSASDSGSSDSGSDRSNRPGAYRTGHQTGSSKTAATREGRRGRPWDGNKARSRSAGSRSSSGGSSAGKPGYESWKYGSRKGDGGQEEWQDGAERSGSHSPAGRHRSDVPPLPHERPVKRPWVAAPGLLTGSLVNEPQKAQRAHSSDQSRGSSRSGSPTGAEEKRFITSWSRSPSSGDNEPPATRRPVRRERLPDVVPGTQPSPRVRHPVTPSIRQRLPDTLVHDPRAGTGAVVPSGPEATMLTSSYTEFSGARPVAARPNASESSLPPASIHERAVAPPRQPTLDHPVAAAPPTSNQPSASAASGGELPSNRPGVRMTLAPRLKASGVNMANIPGGVTRPSGGRTTQQSSPPRLPRLPFPLPSMGTRAHSPVPPGHLGVGSGGAFSQLDIRRQAEAAAAIVEERERRRAAAEAAQRRKNPVKKKRDDLSKIPIRGRPTYRRQSFSDSSGGSGSRSGSRSGSSHRAESVDSRSPSGTPEPNIIMDPVYEDPPSAAAAAKSRKRHKAEPGLHSTAYDDLAPGMAVPYRRQSSRALLPNDGDDPSHPFDRRQRHPAKMINADGGVKYRGERPQKMMNDFAYKMPAQNYQKNAYADYHFPQDAGVYHSSTSRRRDQSHGVAQGHGGMRYPYDEDPMQARYDQTSSRYGDSHRSTGGGGPPYMHPEFLPHHHRAASPSGDLSFGDAFGVRAPQPAARTHKLDRKRPARDVDPYDDPLAVGNRRKRAVIVSPTEPQQTASTTVEMRRARSRHRSRGPGGGAPIDRSEPFESSDTSAAEQRLRELRERLNRVDDAIAEIKAGSTAGGGGGFFDVR